MIENLAWELIKPQIEYGSTIPSLLRELRRRARVLLRVQEVVGPPIIFQQIMWDDVVFVHEFAICQQEGHVKDVTNLHSRIILGIFPLNV